MNTWNSATHMLLYSAASLPLLDYITIAINSLFDVSDGEPSSPT